MYYDPTELEPQVDVVVLESSTDLDYIKKNRQYITCRRWNVDNTVR